MAFNGQDTEFHQKIGSTVASTKLSDLEEILKTNLFVR